MPILPIRKWGDPVLRETARPVERFDGALRRLADDMVETMHDAPGVGLAAPQVGRSIRLVVFDVGEGPEALANPALAEVDGEEEAEEGCLSVPGLYFPVLRGMRVTATGQDLRGEPVTIQGENLLARVLQHEVDHVNGVLFIERLDDEHRRTAMAALRELQLGVTAEKPDRTQAL